jgi:MFS family permease
VRALTDLRLLLRVRAFRRLLGLRLLSQSADGVVSVALASYLFFSPERQTTPGGIAAVTAATLLPFTLAGPFTGVALDRWPRRDVLVVAALCRALLTVGLAGVLAGGASDVLLYVVVIAGFGVNRFLLAGLSAALPHTVGAGQLLPANAIVPTTGTIAYVAGIGLGGLAGTALGDPALVLVAVGGWAAAAVVGLGFPRPALGPDQSWTPPARTPPARTPPAEGGARLALAGLRAAASHLAERPEAVGAIAVVAAQRLCATLTLTAGILLYRSSYASAGETQPGLSGFSVAVLAAGVGFVLAAAVAPVLVERWSGRGAVLTGLIVGALAQCLFAATLAQAALVTAAFALSLGGQVVKICTDTLVQRVVDDDFRGRVFLLYDMAFNAALVSATCIGAVLLPPSGRAGGVMAAVAAALVVTAAVTSRRSDFSSRRSGHPLR